VLSGTYGKKIYEDSPRDSFWGLGKDGKGLNHLGIMLEKIRDDQVNFEASIFVLHVGESEKWFRSSAREMQSVINDGQSWMSEREVSLYSVAFGKPGYTGYCDGEDIFGDDEKPKHTIPFEARKAMAEAVKTGNFDHEIGGQYYECRGCGIIHYLMKCSKCGEKMEEIEM